MDVFMRGTWYNKTLLMLSVGSVCGTYTQKEKRSRARIRTEDAGIKIPSANRYTTQPARKMEISKVEKPAEGFYFDTVLNDVDVDYIQV